MPTSHFLQIPYVIEDILKVKPKTVLEIGIGMGKYGALMMEYLQVWDHYFEAWMSRPLVMDGIEIFPLYRNPLWGLYREVHIGNALDVLPSLGQYDMILMVDVLEHFTKADGNRLLQMCSEHANHIVVAMPTEFAPTVTVWGNAHEVHRTGSKDYDFSQYGSVSARWFPIGAYVATIARRR